MKQKKIILVGLLTLLFSICISSTFGIKSFADTSTGGTDDSVHTNGCHVINGKTACPKFVLLDMEKKVRVKGPNGEDLGYKTGKDIVDIYMSSSSGRIGDSGACNRSNIVIVSAYAPVGSKTLESGMYLNYSSNTTDKSRWEGVTSTLSGMKTVDGVDYNTHFKNFLNKNGNPNAGMLCSAGIVNEPAKGDEEDKKDKEEPAKGEELTGSDTGEKCPVPPIRRDKWRASDRASYSVSGITHYYSEITPVSISGLNGLSPDQIAEWQRTHQAQRSAVVTTEFGKRLQSFNTDGTLASIGGMSASAAKSKFSAIAASLRAAQNADAAKGYSVNIPLSPENQKGFARGGAFTYTNRVRRGYIDLAVEEQSRDVHNCTNTRVSKTDYNSLYSHVTSGGNGYRYRLYNNWGGRYCHSYRSTTTYKYDSNLEKYVPVTKYMCQYYHWTPKWTKTVEKRINPDPSRTYVRVYIDSAFRPNGSYQAINARCNKERMEEIIAATGSTKLSDNELSIAAKSPTSGGVAYYYTPSNLDTELFYSKKCDIKLPCSSTDSSIMRIGEARNNKGDRDSIDDRFGAQIENSNGSKFNLFRDGTDHEIRLDVWAPYDKLNTGEIEFKNAPIQSSFAINADETPTLSSGNLKVSTTSGNEMFNDSRRRYGVSNLMNHFLINGRWASEKNKPIRMQARWDYRPEINTTVVTSMGTGGPSTTVKKEPLTLSCPAALNTLDSQDSTTYNLPKDILPEKINYHMVGDERDIIVDFVKSSVE